jgi:hypothetical protein
MDQSIHPKSPEEIEAEAIAADLAYVAWKDLGGPQRDNDARALRLQQQYSRLCLPEGSR